MKFSPLTGIVLLCVVWFTYAWLTLQLVRAHSFYPWECCSDQDCWPMGTEADAREPEPRATAQGWALADGSIVAYAAARPSPDGRFHVCRHGGRAEGGVIRPDGKPTCFFAPQPSF
jgi:hypothetical protein